MSTGKRKKNVLPKEAAASKISSQINVFSSPTNDDKSPMLDSSDQKSSNINQTTTDMNDEMECEKEQVEASYSTLLDIVDSIDATQANLLTNCNSVGESLKLLREALEANILSSSAPRDSGKLWPSSELSTHSVALSKRTEIQERVERLRKQYQNADQMVTDD
jgi:hypothetical protein